MKRAIILLILIPTFSLAISDKINYQGTLRKDGVIYTGTIPMVFEITNANGSTVYWTSGSTNVYVSAGLFRYPIGTPNETQFAQIPWSAITPYIRVTIDGNQLPPEPLYSSVYSFYSKQAQESPGNFTVKDGNILISTTSGNKGIIFQDGSVQYTAAASGLWMTSGIHIYNSNTGNLGVGTTNPAAKLYVVGTSTITGNTHIGGNLTLSGILSGNGSGLTNLTAANISAGSLGNGVIASSIAVNKVYSASIVDNAITSAKIADGTIIDSDISNSANINLTKLASGDLPSNINVTAIKTGNYLNDIKVSSSIYADFAGSAITSYDPNAVHLSDNQTISGVKTYTSSVTISYEDGINYGLFISSGLIVANGNVGIGTTEPGNKLQVQADSDASYPIKFGYSSGSRYGQFYIDHNGAGFFDGTGTSGLGIYLNNNENYLGLQNGGTMRLSVTSAGVSVGSSYIATAGPTNGMIIAGNVGIGTTEPQDKLHIEDGILRLGSNDGSLEGGQLTLMDADDQGGWNIDNYGSSGSELLRLGFRDKGYNDVAPIIILSTAGNVGIGTMSPEAKLEIAVPAGAGEDKLLTLQRLGGYGITDIYQYYQGTSPFPYGTRFDLGGIPILYLEGDAGAATRRAYFMNGNVGIGTTTPEHKLQVSGSNYIINAYNSSTANDDSARISLRTGLSGAPTAGFEFGIFNDNTKSAGQMGVIQAYRYNAGWVPLDIGILGGNVGIGTTAPGYALTLKGPYASPQTLISYDGSNGIFFHAQGTNTHYNWLIGQQRNISGLEFTPSDTVGGTTFSTPAMVIRSETGNVGIGTIGPSGKLHVSGSTYPQFYIDDNTSRTFALGATISSFRIRDITGNADRVTIDVNGNVGIGTTSPGAKLDIQGSDAPLVLRIQSPATTYGPELRLVSTATGGRDWRIGSGQSANSAGQGKFWIYDGVAAADRFVIDTTGNVGIGTTNPGYKLEVSDTNANIVAKGGTGNGAGYYLGLFKGTGSLPGYPNDSYPTVKTDYNYMYFSVGGTYSAYVNSGGTWTAMSSRESKENFIEVDLKDILAKIEQLPITQWNFKNESPSIKHIGPTAEDFHVLFGLNGNNNKMISYTDSIGVTLAGVKALSEKVKIQQQQIEELQKEIKGLKLQINIGQ